jgi:hypothetical protein
MGVGSGSVPMTSIPTAFRFLMGVIGRSTRLFGGGIAVTFGCLKLVRVIQ